MFYLATQSQRKAENKYTVTVGNLNGNLILIFQLRISERKLNNLLYVIICCKYFVSYLHFYKQTVFILFR